MTKTVSISAESLRELVEASGAVYDLLPWAKDGGPELRLDRAIEEVRWELADLKRVGEEQEGTGGE